MAARNFAVYSNDALENAIVATSARHVTIFSLIDCPQLPFGTRYKLVDAKNGHRLTIGIGRAVSSHQPLNLATVRHLGAQHGCTEVHVFA